MRDWIDCKRIIYPRVGRVAKNLSERSLCKQMSRGATICAIDCGGIIPAASHIDSHHASLYQCFRENVQSPE